VATSASNNSEAAPTRIRNIVAGLVAVAGMATLVGVAAIAIFELPAPEKGPNIVAISSSAFGVIGSIVSTYFGIRSASNAIDQVQKAQ
jgi:cation transporter-like permease